MSERCFDCGNYIPVGESCGCYAGSVPLYSTPMMTTPETNDSAQVNTAEGEKSWAGDPSTQDYASTQNTADSGQVLNDEDRIELGRCPSSRLTPALLEAAEKALFRMEMENWHQLTRRALAKVAVERWVRRLVDKEMKMSLYDHYLLGFAMGVFWATLVFWTALA